MLGLPIGADGAVDRVAAQEGEKVEGQFTAVFFGDALGETREQARLMFERQKKSAP